MVKQKLKKAEAGSSQRIRCLTNTLHKLAKKQIVKDLQVSYQKASIAACH